MGYIFYVPAFRISVLQKLCIPLNVGFAHYTTCATIATVDSQDDSISTPKWESYGSKFKKTKGGVSLSQGYDINFYASMLERCAHKELKEVHGHMFRTGFDQNIIVATKLVHMATVYSAMEYAHRVFDKMAERNVFLWNAIIRGYARNGPCEKAVDLYYEMKRFGILPDRFTFPVVLKACASLSALQEGKGVHARVMRDGFRFDVFVGAALVDMYAKCRCVDDARRVFDEMSWRDSVSWSALIAGYAQNGYADETLMLYYQMQADDVKPDFATMVSVLPACAYLGDMQLGKCIHCYVIKSGFESHVSVGTALVDMYAKCGSTEFALDVFGKMAERNLISWNAMIDGFVKNGCQDEALELFQQMQVVGLKPNSVTVVSVLLSCADVGALRQGKSIHAYIIRSGFELDVSVGNSLVFMYGRCGSNVIARQLFDKMSVRDVVSWNAMIAGYAQNGHGNSALTLFQQMHQVEVNPNEITIVSVLPACADLAALQYGKVIHAKTIKSGFDCKTPVVTALVAMYAKSGEPEAAHQLFHTLSKRDVVSWNAMIGAYAQNGHVYPALALFRQMQLEEVIPNSVTMASVLPACAHLGALQQGKGVHGYIIKSGCELDEFVGTALMDLYAKCGSINTARLLFDKMSEKNVISWSAMIAGYGLNGLGKDALDLFVQMQESGTKPTDVTFVSVLSACSHSGLLNEGWQLFGSMTQDYYIIPKVEHYACMVDLLGRAGHLDEAHDLIKNMPIKPSAGVWGALLGACRIHCNIELGEYVADCLFDLEPANAGYYVLISNIYAAAGRWDDMVKVRQLLKNRGLKKTPGCSWIEINNKVHSFFVGDRSHSQSEEIYATLESLIRKMKEIGYVPNTNFVLHDVEEELKEDMLSCHSEKLAIAFGILNTSPGTVIKITKNLRVCADCHTATKLITKIAMREIIMRDANRFHHFIDGMCSCGDYW